MNAQWWEGFARFLCGYWWILLIIIVLALAAFLMRSYWLPPLLMALGL